MPSEQHDQWKGDLFRHLDRKLSGCVLCEMGEERDDHRPMPRGQHREPSQEIMWTCERMHPHAFDVLRGAGFVEMEKYQYAPHGGRCCPDVTILNTHREPMAFIEIVRYSRRETHSGWRKNWAYPCSRSLHLTGARSARGFRPLDPGGTSIRPCQRTTGARCPSWSRWQTS